MSLTYKVAEALSDQAEAYVIRSGTWNIGYIEREHGKKTFSFETTLTGMPRRGTARSLEGVKKRLDREWRILLKLAGLQEISS